MALAAVGACRETITGLADRKAEAENEQWLAMDELLNDLLVECDVHASVLGAADRPALPVESAMDATRDLIMSHAGSSWIASPSTHLDPEIRAIGHRRPFVPRLDTSKRSRAGTIWAVDFVPARAPARISSVFKEVCI